MTPSKDEWKYTGTAVQPSVDRDLCVVEGIMREVLPFTMPLFTREGLNRAPQQIATSVIVTIAGHVFLLTAAHAIEQFKGKSLLIPLDGQYVSLDGGVCRNDPGPTGHHGDEEQVDTAVLHVRGPNVARLIECAYPFERSLLLNTASPGSYAAVGYPLRLSKKKGSQIFSYPMGWLLPGITEDRYRRSKINPSENLAFEMTKRVATSSGYAPRPSLRGMSGCGVWIAPRVDGMDLPHRLVGLFTGTNKAQALALATNIRRHADCIAHFFPTLVHTEKGKNGTQRQPVPDKQAGTRMEVDERER